MSLSDETIAALFAENRRFDPPADVAANAVLNDPGIYERAAADPLAFWAEWAERLTWRTHWDEVLDWSNAPFAKWFVGGTLNVTESCLDRHVAVDPDKVAFYWEGEPGDRLTVTYKQLLDDVCRMANALDELGVKRNDRVAIYMGMVPELPVAMLACARIGAAHSVVFGGFSAEALADRINDAQAKVLITCDGAWRGGQIVPLKEMADDALTRTSSIEHSSSSSNGATTR
jgi:acetyl-CoA synthetase